MGCKWFQHTQPRVLPPPAAGTRSLDHTLQQHTAPQHIPTPRELLKLGPPAPWSWLPLTPCAVATLHRAKATKCTFPLMLRGGHELDGR